MLFYVKINGVESTYSGVALGYCVKNLQYNFKEDYLNMLLTIFKFIVNAATEKGAKCPRCGRNNTDKENGIWHCYDCGHEW